jgi:hypothetical protein
MRNEGLRIALLDVRAALSGRISGKVLSMHGSMLDGFRADQELRKVVGQSATTELVTLNRELRYGELFFRRIWR